MDCPFCGTPNQEKEVCSACGQALPGSSQSAARFSPGASSSSLTQKVSPERQVTGETSYPSSNSFNPASSSLAPVSARPSKWPIITCIVLAVNTVILLVLAVLGTVSAFHLQKQLSQTQAEYSSLESGMASLQEENDTLKLKPNCKMGQIGNLFFLYPNSWEMTPSKDSELSRTYTADSNNKMITLNCTHRDSNAYQTIDYYVTDLVQGLEKNNWYSLFQTKVNISGIDMIQVNCKRMTTVNPTEVDSRHYLFFHDGYLFYFIFCQYETEIDSTYDSQITQFLESLSQEP